MNANCNMQTKLRSTTMQYAVSLMQWCIRLLCSFDFGKGTVCTSSGSNSRNTGMATDYNFKKKVSYTQAMLVVTHEVGHNFGMEHDTKCNR